MSVILKQFDGGAIAPRDDAILYNSIITRNGILDGCTITHLGANQLKITAGRGIIKGRMFEVEEMTVNCTLASSGTQRGRMYLRMELSNMENPAQIKTVAADTLPELVQEEDCNYTNGIYELELCTYDVTDTLLSNLETTYEVIDTVFPVAKTLDDVNGVTDENVLAGAVAVKELSSDFGGCTFSVQSDGAYVTYTPSGGADPVSKKLGDLTFVQAISADGLQHTVDCTHVQGYTFLTNDSFIFNFKEVSYQTVNNPGEGSTSQNYPLTYNYDSETGMLTYSGGGRHTIASGWDVYITSDIDLYVK